MTVNVIVADEVKPVEIKDVNAKLYVLPLSKLLLLNLIGKETPDDTVPPVKIRTNGELVREAIDSSSLTDQIPVTFCDATILFVKLQQELMMS